MERDDLGFAIGSFIQEGFLRSREGTFEKLALDLFRFQYGHNDFYRRFVDSCMAGITQIKRWNDIPCLPVSAFKHARVASFPGENTKSIFRTSGTTAERRGEFYLDDLSMYARALKTSFKHYCLPDARRMAMASLIPSFTSVPDSSLSYMVSLVFADFGSERTGWFCESEMPEYEKFAAFLKRCVVDQEPVMIFGTALGLWAFLDYCSENALQWALPAGSRVMETGGFKGSRIKITKGELYARLVNAFGIPVECIINEYGMTEMGSQFYSPVFRNTISRSATHTFKEPPPWVRTRVLDPRTGEDAEFGHQGILCHYDLANVGSVFALETGDLGIRAEEGFEIIGRVPAGELRGCSLRAEEQLFA